MTHFDAGRRWRRRKHGERKGAGRKTIFVDDADVDVRCQRRRRRRDVDAAEIGDAAAPKFVVVAVVAIVVVGPLFVVEREGRRPLFPRYAAS